MRMIVILLLIISFILLINREKVKLLNIMTTSLFQYDTIETADVIEFCPIPEYTHHFIYATYQLKEDRTRVGTLGHCIRNNKEKAVAITHHSNSKSGYLDVKWAPHTIQEKILCAGVTSLGNIEIWTLDQEVKLQIDGKMTMINDDG